MGQYFFQDLQVGVWGLYVTDLCSDHENHQNIKFLVPHMGFTGIQLVAHLSKLQRSGKCVVRRNKRADIVQVTGQ